MIRHSALDDLADRHFDTETLLSPIWMTSLGMDEYQDELDDLSPHGVDMHHALVESTLKALDTTPVADATDEVTASAMAERLTLADESHKACTDLMDIANIASGLHSIREVFDLMPMDTNEDWRVIAQRLTAVPHAIDGWFESQFAGIEAGILPSIRQVDALAEQCEGWVKEHGFFDSLAQQGYAVVNSSARDLLDKGITAAKGAYIQARQTLLDKVRPLATPVDAVGEKRYELASRSFLGTKVDFAETYQWGLDQVSELEARQAEICARIRPGMSVAEAKKSLDEDPAYLLHGSDAMRQWMQTRADEAIAELNGVDFDIPVPARRIEAMIAPTHDGGIYYTDPSDDFSRPGRMWWSVPEDQTTFSTWRELTTVHHEGVPGHHLQISAAVANKDSLNKWRRSGIWVSGHGEGWALYAEQLMAELGYLSDPAMMLGMLDGQAMRAVRVVIDMGLHCGFTPPPEIGGSEWTFEKALSYFNAHVAMDPGVARFEVLRYFGWPGQAPSYKIGARVWTEIREEVRAREGAGFTLKDFHTRALNLGSLGLDTLRQALVG